MADYNDWASQSLAGPIDLDADIVDLDVLIGRTRRAAIVRGRAYDFKHDDELSQVDHENLRRIFVRIFEVENKPGEDDLGLLTDKDSAVLARLDERFCQIALHDVSADDVAALAPEYRNAIRNLFYRRFDVTPFSTRMVKLWMQALNRAQQATPTVEANASVDATPMTDSLPTSIASPKKARTSRRASASATRAA